MKRQSTLRSHESITSAQATSTRKSSNSHSITDVEIANLTGALVEAYPFVARPLDDFFPQQRTTARKSNKARGSACGRHVDEELIHLNGYFMEFAPREVAPNASRSSAMPVAPIAVPNVRHANGFFAVMTAVFGAAAVALLIVLRVFAPATASELAASVSTHGVVH